MNKSLKLKNRFYDFCLLFISFTIFLYLLYYLIASEKGIINYYKIKQQYAQQNNIYSKISQENLFLENKIVKLNPKTIDIDYLDEIYRKNNGYINNNEIIIIIED
tara:strand:- start:126 stop:440 length:315 start_codon:yes stop_codon:yes gene_type:complete